MTSLRCNAPRHLHDKDCVTSAQHLIIFKAHVEISNGYVL